MKRTHVNHPDPNEPWIVLSDSMLHHATVPTNENSASCVMHSMRSDQLWAGVNICVISYIGISS